MEKKSSPAPPSLPSEHSEEGSEPHTAAPIAPPPKCAVIPSERPVILSQCRQAEPKNLFPRRGVSRLKASFFPINNQKRRL
jgi:hypothetical protein